MGLLNNSSLDQIFRYRPQPLAAIRLPLASAQAVGDNGKQSLVAKCAFHMYASSPDPLVAESSSYVQALVGGASPQPDAHDAGKRLMEKKRTEEQNPVVKTMSGALHQPHSFQHIGGTTNCQR